MFKIITNEKFMEKLSEDDRLEYQRLKRIENLGEVLGKEVPEKVKGKLEQYSTKIKELMGVAQEKILYTSEIPEELADFRERRDEKIKNIDKDVKKRIEKKANKIPVKLETNSDGSRLIEFNIGGKTRKILDPNLEEYSDEIYRAKYGYENSINRLNDYNYVKLSGMRGEVDGWKNKKLRDYVKKENDEGFDMPTKGQIKEMLSALGKKVELDEEEDQIAMFMYLTGMDGLYWLKEDSDDSSATRSYFSCCNENIYFHFYSLGKSYASLFMIACK